VYVALDTLVPVLPKRLRSDDFVKAMKWTKKIIYEEGHSLPQLAHVWHLVVRHGDLFYPFRSHFVSQIVSTISRLGLSPNCPLEHRQIALACVEMLISWEYIRQQKKEIRMKNEKKDPYNANAITAVKPTVSTSEKEEDYCLHVSMAQMLSNFLIRLALFLADSRDKTMYLLTLKCIELYIKLYLIIPIKNIEVTYFEKLLETFLETNYSTNATGKGTTSATVKEEGGMNPPDTDFSVTNQTKSAKQMPGQSVSTGGNQPSSKSQSANANASSASGNKQSTAATSSATTTPAGPSTTSDKILCAFLQFLTVSINVTPIKDSYTLLMQNVSLIKKLFQPLFHIDNLCNVKVNKLFRMFIVKVMWCMYMSASYHYSCICNNSYVSL
jgi:hypothetical protein